jgi:hypothetical protein
MAFCKSQKANCRRSCGGRMHSSQTASRCGSRSAPRETPAPCIETERSTRNSKTPPRRRTERSRICCRPAGDARYCQAPAVIG